VKQEKEGNKEKVKGKEFLRWVGGPRKSAGKRKRSVSTKTRIDYVRQGKRLKVHGKGGRNARVETIGNRAPHAGKRVGGEDFREGNNL